MTLEELIGYTIEELQAALDKEDAVEVEDHIERHMFLGTVMNLTPSGKVYMPWSSGVTEDEAKRDEEFWENLNNILSAHGIFVFSGEGDSCDILVGKVVENEN